MSNDSKEESRSSDQNIYPLKPLSKSGFKKAVAWFGGREFVASLKGVIMYGLFGENIDPRLWMNPNIYPNMLEKVLNQKEIEERKKLESLIKPETGENKPDYAEISQKATENIKDKPEIQDDVAASVEQDWAKKIFDHWKWKRDYYEVWESFSTNQKFWEKLQPQNQKLDEFWFDYISDSGDGQLGVYNVACLCLSDLWLENPEQNEEKIKVNADVKFQPPKNELDKNFLLPRGVFLFVGGDTAYHSANYATLVERFQHPFRWAFTSVREFAEKNYKLKSDKKFTPATDVGKSEIQELPGSLPGKEKEIEYIDTEPTRPLFGIPANHDYYDGIDGFNRQFRRPPFQDVEENMVFDGKRGKFLLQIPTFSRKQEASYIAIRLPFDWWMFGIDSENEKLDFRQELYFTDIIKQKPAKLILATPEPTTVFGKKSDADEKTATYLKTITEELGLCQPFLENGDFKPLEQCQDKDKTPNSNKEIFKPDPNAEFCRLDLSGDVHHYARYWGEDTRNFKATTDNFHSENYASVVAGGGGAFFDVTKTLIGRPHDADGNRIFADKHICGEIPPQSIFPNTDKSVSTTADRLFDLWNIRRGGYIHHAGFIIAAVLFYFLAYFSNVSLIIKMHLADGVSNPWAIFDNYLFVSLLFFLGSAVFVLVTVFSIKNLIQKLKDKSFKDDINKKWDAHIWQLALHYIPFIFAIPFYFYALANIYDNRNPAAKTPLDNFLISCNLLVNILIFALILWLSSEHTNWLSVRFKIFRKYKIKASSQVLEDPNETTDWKILTLFGKLSRLYSYQYLFSNLLIILAAAFLISAINMFGSVSIAKSLADGVLIVIVLGLFILVALILGLKMGAHYHRTKLYKFYFTIFGLWHYILQITVPLILFFYGDWLFLLISFIFIGIFNGSATISGLIKLFFVKEDEKSFWSELADFRVGAWLTKHTDKFLLFLIWLIYGSALIFIPLYFSPKPTIRDSIKLFLEGNLKSLPAYQTLQFYLSDFFNITAERFGIYFEYYCAIWISILVIGYIGFLMSRVWMSWYLAVSMKFDGHNNEAGGAARIEGFKHILRIKVENDKLTVFVIGFEEAEHELERLKLKLVDKFTLKCKPII